MSDDVISSAKKEPSVKEQAPQATLAAAIAGIGALFPNPIVKAVVGMAAPFLSIGIIWLVRAGAEEWKANAPRRRVKKYLRQIERRLKKLPANAPERPQLEADAAEVGRLLHRHMMQGLVVVAPPPTGPPPSP